MTQCKYTQNIDMIINQIIVDCRSKFYFICLLKYICLIEKESKYFAKGRILREYLDIWKVEGGGEGE